nr:uncharacterized protein LOC127330605 isoform X1 [Lolium perenne]
MWRTKVSAPQNKGLCGAPRWMSHKNKVLPVYLYPYPHKSPTPTKEDGDADGDEKEKEGVEVTPPRSPSPILCATVGVIPCLNVLRTVVVPMIRMLGHRTLWGGVSEPVTTHSGAMQASLPGERREQRRNRMKTTFIAMMLVVTLIYLYLEMMNFV